MTGPLQDPTAEHGHVIFHLQPIPQKIFINEVEDIDWKQINSEIVQRFPEIRLFFNIKSYDHFGAFRVKV